MNKNFLKYSGLIVFCFLFLAPNPAYADVALPMLVFTWPAMALLLFPVVIIEALVLIMMLKIDIGKAITVSFWANAKSTIIGIPLSSIILVPIVILVAIIVEVFHLQGNRLLSIPLQTVLIIPSYNGEDRYMSLAVGLGLIPAYFLSIWIEFGVAKKKLQELDPKVIYSAVQVANQITYAILMGVCFIGFIFQNFK